MAHDRDLWCSPYARRWNTRTLTTGASDTWIAGSVYTPIVGWLWVWSVVETGNALGTVVVRVPGPGSLNGTVATSFQLGASGAIMIPFPVVELSITAQGGAVSPTIAAYPVDTSHASGMYSSSVESWDVFELDELSGAAPEKTITTPTGADCFAVFGPSGASDGCTVKRADSAGATPYLVTFDQNAISHGQQTGTPWIPALPGGSVTVKNFANSAEYYEVRWLFDLGTFGR